MQVNIVSNQKDYCYQPITLDRKYVTRNDDHSQKIVSNLLSKKKSQIRTITFSSWL